MPPLRTHLSRWFGIVWLALCGLGTSGAWANSYDDVDQLVRAGKWGEALQQADRYLADKPRDPQMRLLRGVILNEQGRSSEALAVYQKLSEDYPELPESYNNMAVIHAAQGQFDKARIALEMATRTNPAYAGAFENLGDVYLRLAGQAYARAAQINPNTPALKPKLNAVRDVLGASAKPGPAARPAAPAGSNAARPPSSSP